MIDLLSSVTFRRWGDFRSVVLNVGRRTGRSSNGVAGIEPRVANRQFNDQEICALHDGWRGTSETCGTLKSGSGEDSGHRKDHGMLRQVLALGAAVLTSFAAGCSQCDTCDDFPIPLIGGRVAGPMMAAPMMGSYTGYGQVASPYEGAMPAETAQPAPEGTGVPATAIPEQVPAETSAPLTSPTSAEPVTPPPPPDNTPPAPSAPTAESAPAPAPTTEPAPLPVPAPANEGPAPVGSAPPSNPAGAPVTELPVPTLPDPEPVVPRVEQSAALPPGGRPAMPPAPADAPKPGF